MKNQSLGWVAVCAAAVAAWVCVGVSDRIDARELSTDRFANVFVENQKVEIAISAGDPRSIELRDLSGTEVARQDVAADASRVDFGLLPPGYYEAVVGDSVLPLVVLIDPAKRVSGPTRLATDNAMSWLVGADQWTSVADVLQQCGIRCVRERLAWGGVQPERGRFAWGRYDRTASILHERGIEVYQVFHDIPTWAREDKDHRAAPDDLRDIYRFAQALAQNFRGRVQAWEAWNEPDIFFFSHTSSDCAAFQKAAFLGFRSVDPAQRVLAPSMAHGAGPFSEGLLENGLSDYFDLWNFHMYADPSAYSGRREGFLAQLARYNVVVPDWMTEAGDPLQGPEGVLGRDARIHQAEFLSRAYPQALAAGVDRHFWFVFPFLREGNAGWGLFEPQLRVAYPGLAALGAATYALGLGDCLGSLSLADQDARALAFARGDGSAAVAVWRESDEWADVALPLDWQTVREVRTHLGTPLPLGQGGVALRVKRGAVYLLLARSALDGKLTPPARLPVPPRDPGARRAAEDAMLHKVVVRLRVSQATPDKAIDAYRAPAGSAIPLQAEVYNFGATDWAGDLEVTAPDGCPIEPRKKPVSVAAGERAVVPVQLTMPHKKDPIGIRLVAKSAALQSAPAFVRLCADLNSLEPIDRLPLELDDPARWHKAIAGHGTMEIAGGADGGVKFSLKFSTDGDNWAYPRATYSPVLDLTAFDGLRFEYRTDTTDSGPVRVFLYEPNGAGYISDTSLTGSTTWRSATVLFAQLAHVSATPADSNAQLDLDQVASVSVGAHSDPQSLVLEVRNIEVVKLP